MMVGAANAQVKVLTTVAESDRVITPHKTTGTTAKVIARRSNGPTLRSLSENEHNALVLSSKKNTTAGSKAAPSALAPVSNSQILHSK